VSLEHRIAVGLDGTPASWSALEWAAEHAHRTGRSLELVHVGHLPVLPDLTYDSELGAKILDEALTAVEAGRPQVNAKTNWLPGDPADRLVELSRSFDLVVLGRGRHSVAGRILGGIAESVLRRAHGPVAIVPPHSHATANTVVVGASDTPGGRAAVRFAFEEASQRDAELSVVRSWTTVDWPVASGRVRRIVNVDAWQAEEQARLDETLKPLRAAFPDLKVRTVVTHEPVERVLEREGRIAAAVVMGCRRSDDGVLPRLGAVSSWAVHHFDCPVVIVGHSAAVTNERGK
jgi:nucleotide-binding universal stress UspA family protein